MHVGKLAEIVDDRVDNDPEIPLFVVLYRSVRVKSF